MTIGLGHIVTPADRLARIAHDPQQLRKPAAVPQAARVPHEVFPIAEVGLRQNLPVNVSLGP